MKIRFNTRPIDPEVLIKVKLEHLGGNSSYGIISSVEGRAGETKNIIWIVGPMKNKTSQLYDFGNLTNSPVEIESVGTLYFYKDEKVVIERAFKAIE